MWLARLSAVMVSCFVFANRRPRISLVLFLGILATVVFVTHIDDRGAWYSKEYTVAYEYLWKNDYKVYSRTEDVIVRAVFLDDRPRYGHQRAAVFLVEMRKTILEKSLIVGCTVGRHNGGSFRIFQLSLNTWLHKDHPDLTHDFVLLECYGLPSVDNGSVAFITYKTLASGCNSAENHSCMISVQSERPFYISPPYKPPTDGRKYNFKIAVCLAVVFARPPWLKEWLQYQKAIGIDHIHMIADDSFVKAGGFRNRYIKQAIQDGFLSTDVWHMWLNSSQVWYHSQGLAYQDCVYRFHHQYDYLFVLDTDDFFVPAVSGEPKLPYYIQRYSCYKGTYTFQWMYFYPDCGMKGEVPKDGNITKQLVSNQYWDRSQKSLHYLPDTLDVDVHNRGYTLQYYRIYIPRKIAYVAHMRKGIKPKNGC